MTANINAAFAPFFTHWGKGGPGVKHLGARPTAEQLATAIKFSKHQKAGKETFALAMAMREEGVTAGQIQIACGAPQNNHRRGLITEGLFKRNNVAPVNGHTVYQITLTAKGEAAMKRLEAAQAKAAVDGDAPAKAPKASKAKGAKVKRVRKAKPLGDAAMANTIAMVEGDTAAVIEAPVDGGQGDSPAAE